MPERDPSLETSPTGPTLTRAYAELSGDFNPLHLDPEFAATTPFGGVIVHGSHTLALVVERLERVAPELSLKRTEVRFVAPVPVGAAITLHVIPDPGNAAEVSIRVDDGGEQVFLEGRASFGAPACDQGIKA